jgi:hypothetical protein
LLAGAPEAPCRRVVGAHHLLDGVERLEGGGESFRRGSSH